MNRLLQKSTNRVMRKNRIRTTVKGTTKAPRLSVFVSNRSLTAQIIDDTQDKTIAYATTASNKEAKGSMTDKAEWLGAEIAKKAKAKKVKQVVFDRNGRKYHGRIKALADAARKSGLEF